MSHFTAQKTKTGRWCKLPKGTQLVRPKARVKPKQAIPMALALNQYISLAPPYNRYS